MEINQWRPRKNIISFYVMYVVVHVSLNGGDFGDSLLSFLSLSVKTGEREKKKKGDIQISKQDTCMAVIHSLTPINHKEAIILPISTGSIEY